MNQCTPVKETGDIVESSFRASPVQYLKSALSVNTHYGCDLDCVYCILSAHGFPGEPLRMVEPEDAVTLLYNSGYPLKMGMPIAVNNKSEPLHPLVKKDTFRILELLAKKKIKNPVQIISKLGYDDEDLEFLEKLSMNLYHFTSYAGLPSAVEPVNDKKRLDTIKTLKENTSIKVIHYWRPIIEGVNDRIDDMVNILDFVAHNCDATLVSGIKLPKTVIQNLKECVGIDIEYDYLSTEIKRLNPDVFRALAKISHEKYPDFPLFRHTSCVFSFFESYPDYWCNYTFGDSNCNPYCPKFKECTGNHFPSPELIQKEIRRFSDGTYLALPDENLVLLPEDITLDEFSHLLFALRTRVARKKDLYLMWDLDEDEYVRKYAHVLGWS